MGIESNSRFDCRANGATRSITWERQADLFEVGGVDSCAFRSACAAMVDDPTRTMPRISEANLQKYTGNCPAWWHGNIDDHAIARIELVQAKKVVTVFCEYSSDCLTDFEGHEIPAEYLPIGASLIARIRTWCRLLERLGEEQAIAEGPVNWKPFIDEGYQIAVALKQELPDWTVNYADEFKTYLAPGGYFCPEILADGSLGPCTVGSWKGKIAADSWNTFMG